MDPSSLVENHLAEPKIDDGLRLLEQFVADGGSFIVAFWAREAETGTGIWSLNIASESCEFDGSPIVVNAVRQSLQKIPDSWISILDIHVRSQTNRLVKKVLAVLDRHPGQLPIRIDSDTLRDESVTEVYIYPRKIEKVTIHELIFDGEPSGASHLSFEPHHSNVKLTVYHGDQLHEYPAKTDRDWLVAAPEGAMLQLNGGGNGPHHLVWNLRGNPVQSDASEIWSLAKLGLHGFRFLRKPH